MFTGNPSFFRVGRLLSDQTTFILGRLKDDVHIPINLRSYYVEVTFRSGFSLISGKRKRRRHDHKKSVFGLLFLKDCPWDLTKPYCIKKKPLSKQGQRVRPRVSALEPLTWIKIDYERHTTKSDCYKSIRRHLF